MGSKPGDRSLGIEAWGSKPGDRSLGIEAYLGTTRHGGSVVSTRELIELCHVTRGSRVLDVGCGVGATACYLARKIGCYVVCVDLRENMVIRAKERAERDRVADRVESRVADALKLPREISATCPTPATRYGAAGVSDANRGNSLCGGRTCSGEYGTA